MNKPNQGPTQPDESIPTPAHPHTRRSCVKRVLAAGAAASLSNAGFSHSEKRHYVHHHNYPAGFCESPQERRLRAFNVRYEAALE